MNQNDLQERLRHAAEELPPTDLVAGSLAAAHRIRVRRRRTALAGAAALAVAVVAAVSTWTTQPQHVPPTHQPTQPPKPSPTTDVATVRLEDGAPGTLPPYDRIDAHHVFHGADGREFALASPETIADVGDAWVDLPKSLLVLHHTSAGYSVAVDGGQPMPVLAVTGEGYRALSLGPHGTAYLPGNAGDIVAVDSRGQVTHIPTGGRDPIVATRDYYWGIAHKHVWRLDPARPGAGWTDMGPGSDLAPLYTSDAIWVSVSNRCAVLHDAHSFSRLRDACDGGQLVDWPSPDGRYGVRPAEDEGSVEVVEVRTGRVVLRVDPTPGMDITLGGTSSWTGGTSIWSGDVFWLTEQPPDGGGQRWSFACDAQALTCSRVNLPGAIWFGTPVAR